MKHWLKVQHRGSTTLHPMLGDDLEAYIDVSSHGIVCVGITPRGDSTVYLMLDELKELVTIMEAHEA